MHPGCICSCYMRRAPSLGRFAPLATRGKCIRLYRRTAFSLSCANASRSLSSILGPSARTYLEVCACLLPSYCHRECSVMEANGDSFIRRCRRPPWSSQGLELTRTCILGLIHARDMARGVPVKISCSDLRAPDPCCYPASGTP